MRLFPLLIAVVIGMSILVSVTVQAGAPPVPYNAIPDPPDDAVRHITVNAQDRGPVWLLTGLLHGWSPEMDTRTIARLKPQIFRSELWPYYYPASITANHNPKWNDVRDSAADLGKYLDMINTLRAQGMKMNQLLQHMGPYYGVFRIDNAGQQAYHDHIYNIVRYARHMGASVDYWEPWNEPDNIPQFWKGTREEYLATWDSTYDAVRKAAPDAMIVGPSYTRMDMKDMTAFLDHCLRKNQRLDVLNWHDFCPPDVVYQHVEQIRQLVNTKYQALGIKEYHVGEWKGSYEYEGPGTHVAFFYYLDLAGLDRAVRTSWTEGDLDLLMVNAKIPRTKYWAWKEYADGTGVRLVTETNDRCTVAIGSRDDAAKTVRALVGRWPLYGDPYVGSDKLINRRPPIRTDVDFEGVPISGKAEVRVLKLGPDEGPLFEEDLPKLTAQSTAEVTDGKLTVTLDKVAEGEAYSIRVAPIGTAAAEEAAAKTASEADKAKAVVAPMKSEKELHRDAIVRAEKAAKKGIVRINCGATLGYTDLKGNGWFPDQMYSPGSWGHVLGGTVYRPSAQVAGTDIPEIYKSELWGVSEFRYPLAKGKYRLRLHFSETYAGSSVRTYGVQVNGKTVLEDFDPFIAAGGQNKAFVKEYQAQVSDGILVIKFVPSKDSVPTINGIEIMKTR